MTGSPEISPVLEFRKAMEDGPKWKPGPYVKLAAVMLLVALTYWALMEARTLGLIMGCEDARKAGYGWHGSADSAGNPVFYGGASNISINNVLRSDANDGK